MEVDGPLSAQEQMIILYEIKLQCQQNLSNTDPGFTGKKKKQNKKHTSVTGEAQHVRHGSASPLSRVAGVCVES